MKSERLLSILLHLQSKGRVSAPDLARRLEVSERTIHRDMESLSASGIPVYAERGRTGGWCLSAGYRTNLTGMKRQEIRALLLSYSNRALSDLGLDGSFDDAFLKLLASLPSAFRKDVEMIRERVYVDSPGWQMESPELLPLLHAAIDGCRTLIVEYSKKGTTTRRTVDPLGLIARGPIWYLATREGKKYRTFRVSNLRSAIQTGPVFERPPHFDLRAHWQQWWKDYQASLPEFMITLRMAEELFSLLRSFPWVNRLQTVSRTPGKVTVQLNTETLPNAVRLVLWLGADVTVLQPRSLCIAVIGEAEGIVRNHKHWQKG